MDLADASLDRWLAVGRTRIARVEFASREIMKIKVKYGRGCRGWIVYELSTSWRGTRTSNIQLFDTWHEAITEALDRADKALLHGIMQGGWI